MLARTVAFANQKGGVAKTTSAVTVAAALAELGRRVLLVDLDAQACATFSLGLDPEDLPVGLAETLLQERDPREVVCATDDGVDLLPATSGLGAADHVLAGRPRREHAVADVLRSLTGSYDWIVLDCAPALGILTVGALVAADGVIVPVQCETLSHRGVGQLFETITDVQRLVNPRLRVLGILPTAFDGRTAHARSVLADLPERYGVPVLPPITRSIRFAEAPATGRSVLATAGSTRGADDYRQVARWLDQESATD